MAKIYEEDVGTKITLDLVEDISSSTVWRIYYKKPSGTTGYWTASREGGTNHIYYVTTTGGDPVTPDLDEAGIWKLQGYIEMPGWTGRSETIEMKVYRKFT